MKLKIIAVIVALFMIVVPTVVQADPFSASGSGYAVTTNYHGIEVIPPPDPPLVANVSVLADYHFDNLYKINVTLRDEDDNVVDWVVHEKTNGVWDLPEPGWIASKAPNGKDIFTALTDPLDPTNRGFTWVAPQHYSVKAYFYAQGGQGLANDDDLDAMRAVTVMTIPEAPLGTLTILLTMIAGLAIFARKRL